MTIGPIPIEQLPPSIAARGRAVMADLKLKADDIISHVKALKSAPPDRQRAISWALADVVNSATSKHSPCSGCNKAYCCFQAVTITLEEAEAISKKTGLPMLSPPSISSVGEEMAKSKLYAGTPCPFLDPVTRACTVYEVRPFVCRMHHTLEDSPDPCQITEGKTEVRSVDLHEVSGLVTLVGLQHSKHADIREWFHFGSGL